MLDGQKYTSAEQYYQHNRALRMGDTDNAAKILLTSKPIEQMRIGRQLTQKGDNWDDSMAEQLMETGVKAKFSRNPDLLKKLIDTGTRALIDCNIYDKFWGNGIGFNNGNDKNKWKGRNLMGTVLFNVREAVK